MLVDQFNHQVLSLYFTEVADFQLVDLLDKLQSSWPFVMVYLKADSNKIIKNFVRLLFLAVAIV